LASEVVYRGDVTHRWVPHWLKFPLTLFAIICPVAFLLVATSTSVFSAVNIGAALIYIVEKTLVYLIAPLFVCCLVALANLVALWSSTSHL
jgi:hypothetical protein